MKGHASLPLHGIAIYNPDLLSKEELVAQFVARRPLLQRLVEDLRRAGGNQHTLVIGQRGMGKTTLLRRLRYAVEDDQDLASRWLPLSFPEEQYNVARLSDLYLNCIDALSDALDRTGRSREAQALDAALAALPDRDETERAKRALALLLDASDKLKRKLLLLVDNVDLILGRLTEPEGWALREVLSRESRVRFVGASAAMMEATFEYKKPFYDFFKTEELRGLSAEETCEVLVTLARLGNTPEVAKIVEQDPSRIKTLHTLAGGNPRTIVLLYDVLAHGPDGDVRSDLERVLDRCTPLYKARFEELAPQAQQIVHELAIHWDPISAGELAELVRLDVRVVSAQLSRLENAGVVEKVPYDPETKTGFQVAERFFNIWYLMRASRRVRQRLLWLVEFLRMMYRGDELRKQAERHLCASVGDSKKERWAEYGFALAQVVEEDFVRRALEAASIRTLVWDRELRLRLGSMFDLEGADKPIAPLVERQKIAAEVKETVLGAKVRWKGWNAERVAELLAGSPGRSLEEKLQIARQLPSSTTQSLRYLSRMLEQEWGGLLPSFGNERILRKLYEAIGAGLMVGLGNIEDGRTAAMVLQTPELATAAYVWTLSGRKTEAWTQEEISELEKANRHAPLPTAYDFLGDVFVRNDQFDMAEKAYRDAMKLSPKLVWPVWGLALLLHFKLSRYDEAETMYRAAIELSPHSASLWGALGSLLCVGLGRYEEAEQALRAALKLEPEDAESWHLLSVSIFARKGATDDVEAASRRSLEIRPDVLQHWQWLVAVLGFREKWAEADALHKNLIEGHDLMSVWRTERVLLRQAIRGHRASEALHLFDDPTLAERYRPLREALAAIVAGSKRPLRRVAPEVRVAAEQIYDDLLSDADLNPTPVPAAPKPPRKSPRRKTRPS